MCSVTVKRWHIGTAGAARTAYPCAFLGVLLLEKASKAFFSSPNSPQIPLCKKALFSSPNSPQIPLCKKEIPHHIKMSTNIWSTKCR
jgi:hypothetical protein